mgnify:CR=1 FL=1
MNKYLVVFNTCEINVPNLEWYIECIDNLLDTDYDNFDLAISGCMLTDNTKKVLLEKYKNKAFLILLIVGYLLILHLIIL